MRPEIIFDSFVSDFLFPFSVIYGAFMKIRNKLYGRILKKRSLPGFVISVGNITVGGTGKTPLVIEIAKWAKEKGYNPAVISIGYKGRFRGIRNVCDGKRILSNVEECGDEAFLIARKLNIPVVVSKNRFLAGIYLKKKGLNFFILDDAFQYVKLERDLDIVLINGKKPFGNKRLLPSGPLREPISHIKRADIILITEGLFRIPFNKDVFFAKYIPESLVIKGKRKDISAITGKKIIAFSGISNPERFEDMLRRLGAELIYFKKFPDHYWYKEKDISQLMRLKKDTGADYVVTTEKDWVKIMKSEIAFIEVRLEIREKEKFFQIIDEKYRSKKYTD